MTSVRWHSFTQPYEPREDDADPFFSVDRATGCVPSLSRQSPCRAPGELLKEMTNGNRR
jgi:hypothetical protein